MRVGVIGTGNMGINHVRIYRELGAELVGISDSNPETGRKVAAQYNTKAYADIDELLDQKLDAVSIVVPTSLHKEVAIKAIQHGVNVLIEKPIADSAAGALEIIKAAEAKKVKVLVGHIERFNPAVRRLKQVIDSGVLGKIIFLSARRVGPYVPRIIDVGIILDVAPHDIDIMRYLAGQECDYIVARASCTKNPRGDAAFILLGFGDISASIEANWHTPYKVRTLTVTGSKGTASLDYINQELLINDAEWAMTSKIVKEEPLKAELKHFLDCVKNDLPPLVSGTDGMRALEIAIQAEKVACGVPAKKN